MQQRANDYEIRGFRKIIWTFLQRQLRADFSDFFFSILKLFWTFFLKWFREESWGARNGEKEQISYHFHRSYFFLSRFGPGNIWYTIRFFIFFLYLVIDVDQFAWNLIHAQSIRFVVKYWKSLFEWPTIR